MKKILVLGGNGFIGRNLCRYLRGAGEDVYSFDMSYPKEQDKGIHYLEGDFFDDYTLREMIEGMDIIFHAICTLNPGNSNEKCILGYERDFVQTAKLCNYIKDKNCRLIFLSSGGTVYGNQEHQPISEDAVPVPINHYGNLKLCIENTIRTFNFQSKRHMLVARISNPYGPGQDYLKGVGFIDAALKRALHGEPIEVWGDGSIVRDYIYIEDVCRMLHALVYYHGPYEVFNVSSNTATSQKDVLRIIEQLVPHVEIRYLPARNVDAHTIMLDNSRMKEVDDFELIRIEQGINRYYEYIVDNMNEER
ncbi:MAG: NAD-dependent epimerase/dehydratase family protein [Eubacteriales bacterium]|nr:NAD-dependent epimerase/dehydratase family protein [Eubacteriales bacterium]